MAGGAFPLSMLQEVISTISIQNNAKVVMIADACRSGKLSGNSVNGAQITGSNLARQYSNEVKILSCQPDEYSIEGEQWGGGRGAFSYHLIDGLYGMADTNNDKVIDLKELTRYLEDIVTPEVEPQSQIPLTIGKNTERLAEVIPEHLQVILDSRKGGLKMFASVESRGIEEEALANADTTIVEKYMEFKNAIAQKRFFSPTDKCADDLYVALSKEPQLEKLHSSMKRNYAAALQDDAQQALFSMLNDEGKPLSRKKAYKKYSEYPIQLERAAEILGENHYMYRSLIARKLFFEARLLYIKVGYYNFNEKYGKEIIRLCRESLTWEPHNPHVYHLMSISFGYNLKLKDSLEVYYKKAHNEVKDWNSPTIMASLILHDNYGDFESAKSVLDNASGLTDTIAIQKAYARLYFSKYLKYHDSIDLKRAEEIWTSQLIANKHDIQLYILLGFLYNNSGRPSLGRDVLLKGIAIDSTFGFLWANLAASYRALNQMPKSIETLHKLEDIDSTIINTYVDLGINYLMVDDLVSSKLYFEKAFALDSASLYYKEGVLHYFFKVKDYFSAKKCLEFLTKNYKKHKSYTYNLACMETLLGNVESGFNFLEEAISYGYNNYYNLQVDADLSKLRQNVTRWNNLMQKYFPDKN